MKPTSYRVVTGYQAAGGDALVARRGDPVQLGKRSSEWPGWIWCTSDSGRSAWVPESWVERSGQSGVMLRDYSSVELTIQPGDELFATDIESGWARVRTLEGKTGWVPLPNLERTAGGPVKRTAARLHEVLRLLYAMLLSFLPAEQRKKRIGALNLNPASVSAMTGFVLFFGGAIFAIRCFLLHASRYADILSGKAVESDVFQNDTGAAVQATIYSGAATFIGFFFTPAGMLSAYIVLNGFARLVTYIVMDASVGDPILAGLHASGGLLFRRARDERRKLSAGPVLPDRFVEERGGAQWDLVVQSTREKKDWRESLSIKIGDEFYRLVGRYEMKEPGTGHLRFCYRLKKMSVGEPIRAFIEHRHPE
jgi:hypothetical protein